MGSWLWARAAVGLLDALVRPLRWALLVLLVAFIYALACWAVWEVTR
jgi:hypothetical protein